MGWKFLDDIADKFEEGVEDAGKFLGKGADKAAHLVGDGLDAIGLHSAAQAVDGFGDDVADTLGAQVGESQLGQTEDPAKLVHGDVAALNDKAAHLTKFAAAFGKVADGLHRIDTAHWTGDAADQFRARYHQHPTQWSDASDACARASAALTEFAGAVKSAQAQAAEAVKLYKQSKQQSEQAHAAYQKQVDSYNTAVGHYNFAAAGGEDPGPAPAKPGEFHDPGADGVKQAQQLLNDARSRRNAMGDAAKAAVEAATAKAPAEPRFTDRLLAESEDLGQEVFDGNAHFFGGMLKGAGGIVKFGRSLNPVDPYNVTHPAEYVAGLSGTAAGLLHTANHPLDLVKGMLGDGWASDPAEALGKLVPNVALAVGTDGAGAAEAAGERMVVSAGEAAAEQGALRTAAESAGKLADHPATFEPPPPAPEMPHLDSLGEDFGPAGHDFGPEGGKPITEEPPPQYSSSISQRLDQNWDSYEHHSFISDSPEHLDGHSGISDTLDGHHPAGSDPGTAPDHPGDHGHDHAGDGHHADDTGTGAHHDGDTAPPADHAPPPDYAGDPHFHATDADRAAYRENYWNYDRYAKEIHDIVAKHPEFAGMREEELVGIRGYTSDDYYEAMNQGLRQGNEEFLDRYDSHAKSAVSGLNQLPAYEGRVFRGISVEDPGKLDQLVSGYEPGSVYREPAFFSTDTDKAFPGNVQYDVYSTSGRYIKDLSVHQSESEVLFPPGTEFKVIDKKFMPGKMPTDSGTWYITLMG